MNFQLFCFVQRSKPNLSKNYISKCEWVVYDLHSGNPEDVRLALEAFKKKKEDDEQIEQTLVLISSLLAWDKTPKNLEEIVNPADLEEERRLAAEAAEKAAKADQDDEDGDGDADGDGDGEDANKEEKKDEEAKDGVKDGEVNEEGEGDGEDVEEDKEEGEGEMDENQIDDAD